MTKPLSEENFKNYLLKLEKYGEYSLYRKIVGEAFLTLEQNKNPENFILDCSEACFILYRRTGNSDFFILGKVFRRAAHTIYRELIKTDKTKINYKKFLNII